MYGVGSTTSGLAQLEQRASFQVENMVTSVGVSTDVCCTLLQQCGRRVTSVSGRAQTALVALGMVDSPDCHVFKLNVASKKCVVTPHPCRHHAPAYADHFVLLLNVEHRLDKLGAFKVDFAEEEPGMSAVAFGRRNTIATGGEDGVLRVWKLNTGNDSVAAEAQHEFKGHEKPIADVSFHPNGVIVRGVVQH